MLALSIGRPEEQQDCIASHPRFFKEAIPRLRDILDKVVGRKFVPRNNIQVIVFLLGRLAIEDFMEILLLSGNGYGNGALKLLRGMFERVVHARYFVRHPDELQAYLDYDYVNQKKLIEHGAKLPQSQIEEVMAQYERVKAQFVDNSGRVRGSWTTRDLASMAREVGLGDAYLTHSYWPTLQIHSTVVAIKSRLKESEGKLSFTEGPQRYEASVALCGAHMLVGVILEDHNSYFALGLDKDATTVQEDFRACWDV